MNEKKEKVHNHKASLPNKANDHNQKKDTFELLFLLPHSIFLTHSVLSMSCLIIIIIAIIMD